MRGLILMALLISSFNVLANPKGRPAVSTAKSCAQWMSAFNKYEDEINGDIVWRYNRVQVRNWDPNEQFSGILMLKELAGAVLVAEYRSKLGEVKTDRFDMLLPFELDARYKIFENFKPLEFFRFEDSGVFTLRLMSGQEEICKMSGNYRAGH